MNHDYIVLDRSLDVAMHEQIRQCISNAINRGLLKEGNRLPTEEELRECFGISRSVVQQAYSTLAKEGYILRIRHRGTFVAPTHRRGIFIDHQFNFAREMETRKQRGCTVVIVHETVEATLELAARLQIEPGDLCLHLERMRYADARPDQWVENYIVLKYFPGLEFHDYGKESLYSVLGRSYNVKIDHACRGFSATVTDEKMQKLIGGRLGEPMLQVENVVFDQYMRIFEYTRILYMPDYPAYEFDVYDTLDFI